MISLFSFHPTRQSEAGDRLLPIGIPPAARLVGGLAFILLLAAGTGRAQELEPNAYSPSPTGFNILVLADTYNTGDLSFDPNGPITEASAQIHTAAFAYVRTLGLAGRAASLGFGFPYARGDLQGRYFGEYAEVYRSGLGDPRLRVAINLLGAPAMTPKEFAAHRPGRALGASLVVSPPLGQYDPTKLINIGANRWAFKPEFGYTHTVRKWTWEADVGVWLFTDNNNFYGGKTKVQEPISSLQGHVIYTFKPRMWLSFDANFYRGGETSVNGGPKTGLQENSRMGVVFALPVTAQHSLKFSYSRGAVTRIGADFSSFGVAWQYIWRD